MGICRSVVNRGQIRLPLDTGEPELALLEQVLPAVPVIATTAATAKEYL